MSGFTDKMEQADQIRIELKCAHDFTGGAMKCKNCGDYFEKEAEIIARFISAQWDVNLFEFHNHLSLLDRD